MKRRITLLFVVLLFAFAGSVARAQAAWAPNVSYAVGALVTYQDATHPNHIYKCIQAHTSLTGWEPPNVPALWQDMGPAGTTSTNTPVPPTKTNTPAPTKTNTPSSATATPTRTNTPAGASATPANTATKTNTPAATIPATNTPVPPTRTNTPAIPTNTPSGATSTPAPGAPAKPTIAIEKIWDGPGGGNWFKVNWSMWYGINGTSWQLLEDGRVIFTGSLTASSPNAQSGTYQVQDKTYGLYTYIVKLINSAGATASDPVSVMVGGASKIKLSGFDSPKQALQITVNQGVTDIPISMADNAAPTFALATNNASVISFQMLNSTTLRITGLKEGRSSIRIKENATGETRFVGVRVRTSTGAIPGMPKYVSVGSVSEDTDAHLNFWHDYQSGLTNKHVDIRYVYLIYDWRNPATSSMPIDGGRMIKFIRESLKLGMIPYFVYYSIPDGSESYSIDRAHIEDSTYMTKYFKDLKFATDIAKQEAGDEMVGFVLEPDFIGYMMQNRYPTQPNQMLAKTSAAYSSGVLTSGVDPAFTDTLDGLVKAINYIINKNLPNAYFGWQFNLWASPGVTVGVPGNGLMHLTDTMGITNGRNAIANEAQAITNFYVSAGVATNGADFVSIDKYGLDAGMSSPNDPANSQWFWNADHWNNYLLFTSKMKSVSTLPVILWQIPVGHVNTTQTANPYGGSFPVLDNTAQHGEDSAPSFLLGDTFTPGSSTRYNWFATNQGGDPKVTSNGTTVTWGNHMLEAKNNGIICVLFGAGVGGSTQGVGSPPTDGYWWIVKTQAYYNNVVPIP